MRSTLIVYYEHLGNDKVRALSSIFDLPCNFLKDELSSMETSWNLFLRDSSDLANINAESVVSVTVVEILRKFEGNGESQYHQNVHDGIETMSISIIDPIKQNK